MIGDALSDGAALVPPTEADASVGEKLRSLSRNGVSEGCVNSRNADSA